MYQACASSVILPPRKSNFWGRRGTAHTASICADARAIADRIATASMPSVSRPWPIFLRGSGVRYMRSPKGEKGGVWNAQAPPFRLLGHSHLVAERDRLHREPPHPEEDEEVGQLARDPDRDIEHGRSLTAKVRQGDRGFVEDVQIANIVTATNGGRVVRDRVARDDGQRERARHGIDRVRLDAHGDINERVHVSDVLVLLEIEGDLVTRIGPDDGWRATTGLDDLLDRSIDGRPDVLRRREGRIDLHGITGVEDLAQAIEAIRLVLAVLGGSATAGVARLARG